MSQLDIIQKELREVRQLLQSLIGEPKKKSEKGKTVEEYRRLRKLPKKTRS